MGGSFLSGTDVNDLILLNGTYLKNIIGTKEFGPHALHIMEKDYSSIII